MSELGGPMTALEKKVSRGLVMTRGGDRLPCRLSAGSSGRAVWLESDNGFIWSAHAA